MRQYGLRARKGLGQHFLVDASVLEMIAEAAELSPEDTVVEVGPGLGVLTDKLAQSVNRLLTIELDTRIVDLLKKRFADFPGVTVLNADVLEADMTRIGGPQSPFQDREYKVVANLPYYIAAATVRHFLESPVRPKTMVVMVQKEVARNMAAAPGDMSLVSVGVQLYGKASLVCDVPASSFHPPPKVDSAVVRIDVYPNPAVHADITEYFRIVKAGFSAPRKQLRNSLAKGLSVHPSLSEQFLIDAGIDPQRRAQTVALEEWARLLQSVTQGLEK